MLNTISLIVFAATCLCLVDGKATNGNGKQAPAPLRILFVSADMNSHLGSFYSVINAATAAGHRVSVFHFQSEAALPKLPDGLEDLRVTADVPVDKRPLWLPITEATALGLLAAIPWSVGFGQLRGHHNDTRLTDILDQWRWDVLVVDSLFAPAGMLMATMLDPPRLTYHTSLLLQSEAWSRNMHWVPSVTVPIMINHSDEPWKFDRFFNRLLATIMNVAWNAVAHGYVQSQMNAIRPLFDMPPFSISAFEGSPGFVLTEELDRLVWPMPRTHNQLAVGVECPHELVAPLDGELLRFVSQPGSKGTILVAFGTIVDFADAPQYILRAFTDALSQLTDYRIIWSYKGPDLGELGAHVRIMRWVPQKSLLFHKSTVLFVTHGGLKSVKESVVCARLPVLFMPMFAEQMRNAYIMRKFGIAHIVDRFYLTADDLKRKMVDLITDGRHKRAAERAAAVYTDRIVPSHEEATFWLQYTAKRGNGVAAEFFLPRCAHLNILRCYCGDVLLLASVLFVAAERLCN